MCSSTFGIMVPANTIYTMRKAEDCKQKAQRICPKSRE